MSESSVPSLRVPRRWPRIVLLAVLSLLLHVLLVDWGKSQLLSNAGPDASKTITVTLRPVPPPTQPVSLPVPLPVPLPAAPPKPAPKKTAPARKAAPALDAIHAPLEVPDEPIRETVQTIVAPVAPDAPVAPVAPVATDAPVAAATGTATVAPAGQDQNQGAGSGDDSSSGKTGNDGNGDSGPDSTTGTHYQTSPPPSAKLQYAVRATYKQLPVQGYGTLDWQTDGKTYRLEGKAGDFLFTFLNFSSSGEIDTFGVAPELYTEKPMYKSATNTHFNRQRQQISFSASTASYPRQGGEQDRASLIWQLAAIGRGDPGQLRPGAVIDLFVAGTRDGEVWRIQVLGQEDITVPAGDLRTWHVVRMPKPGSYDQRIDIWLAPLHEWYPARLRYTDTRKDGDYTEMSLSKLQQ